MFKKKVRNSVNVLHFSFEGQKSKKNTVEMCNKKEVYIHLGESSLK